MPGSFFQCFTNHSLDQRLARLEMTSGLIKNLAATGDLFDQQKTAILLDDRSNCYMRIPWHLRSIPAVEPGG